MPLGDDSGRYRLSEVQLCKWVLFGTPMVELLQSDWKCFLSTFERYCRCARSAETKGSAVW